VDTIGTAAAPTRIRIGERFSLETVLSRDDIRDAARLLGDDNPVHLDEQAAIAAGFSGIIAAGPHTSALHSALLAKHYSKLAPMLGLEYSVRFHRVVTADAPLYFEWEVVAVEYKPSLKGELVSLVGKVVQGGRDVMTGTSKVVVRFPEYAAAATPAG